jgi:hypothetical protein
MDDVQHRPVRLVAAPDTGVRFEVALKHEIAQCRAQGVLRAEPSRVQLLDRALDTDPARLAEVRENTLASEHREATPSSGLA